MDEAALSNKYGPEFEKMVQMEMEKMMSELYGDAKQTENPHREPPVQQHRSPPRAEYRDREPPVQQYRSPPRANHHDSDYRQDPESPRGKARLAYADDLFGNHVINGDQKSKEVDNANNKWRPSFPDQDREKKFREVQRDALEQQKKDDIEFRRQKKSTEKARELKEEQRIEREMYELEQEQKGDYSHHSKPRHISAEKQSYGGDGGHAGGDGHQIGSPMVSPSKLSRNRLVNDVYGGNVFNHQNNGDQNGWRPSHGESSDREKQFRRNQKEQLLAQMEEDKALKAKRKKEEADQELRDQARMDRERLELEHENRGDFSHLKNPRHKGETESDAPRVDISKPSASRYQADIDSNSPQQQRSPGKASRQQLVSDVYGGNIFDGKTEDAGWRPSMGESSQREKRFRENQKEQLLVQMEEDKALKAKRKKEEADQELRDQARMDRERLELEHENRGDFSHLKNHRRKGETESPRVAEAPARHVAADPDSFVPQQKRSPTKASRQQLVSDVFGGDVFGAEDDAGGWKPSHQRASKREQNFRENQKEQLLVQMEEDKALKQKLKDDEAEQDRKDELRLDRQRQELAYEGRGQFGHLMHRKAEPPVSARAQEPPSRDGQYDYEDADSDREYQLPEEQAHGRRNKPSPSKGMRSIQEEGDSDGGGGGQADWRAAQRERNAAIAAAASSPSGRYPGGVRDSSDRDKPSRYAHFSEISSEGATKAALGHREPRRAMGGPGPDMDYRQEDDGDYGGGMSRMRSLEGRSHFQPGGGVVDSGYYVKTPPSLLFKSPKQSYEDVSMDRVSQAQSHGSVGGVYGEHGQPQGYYDKASISARAALTSPEGFLRRFQMKYQLPDGGDPAGRQSDDRGQGQRYGGGNGPDLGVMGSHGKPVREGGTMRTESTLVPVEDSSLFGEGSVLEQSLCGVSQLNYDFMQSVAVSSDVPGGLAGRLTTSRDRLRTPEAIPSVDYSAEGSYSGQRSQHESRHHSASGSKQAPPRYPDDSYRSSKPATPAADYGAEQYQSRPGTGERVKSRHTSKPATPAADYGAEQYESRPGTAEGVPSRSASKPATPAADYGAEQYQSRPGTAEGAPSRSASKPATPAADYGAEQYESRPGTGERVKSRHTSKPATPAADYGAEQYQSRPGTAEGVPSRSASKPSTPSIVLRSEVGRQALADTEVVEAEPEIFQPPKERVPDKPYVPAADMHAELGIHLADEDEEEEIMIMASYPPTGAVKPAVAADEVEEDYGDDYEDEA